MEPFQLKQLSGLRSKARKDSHHQERPTISPDLKRRNYRVGEFHTAKNLGEKLYKRYVEVCKLLDLELTNKEFVTPFTKDSWEKHIAADDEKWPQTDLMVSVGPYMSIFLEATKGLGISWSPISGGALIGDQAYAMFLYPELANLFTRSTFTTTPRPQAGEGANFYESAVYSYFLHSYQLLCLVNRSKHNLS